MSTNHSAHQLRLLKLLNNVTILSEALAYCFLKVLYQRSLLAHPFFCFFPFLFLPSVANDFVFMFKLFEPSVFCNFLNLFWYFNSAAFIVGQSSQHYYCAVTIGDDAVISAFRLVW